MLYASTKATFKKEFGQSQIKEEIFANMREDVCIHCIIVVVVIVIIVIVVIIVMVIINMVISLINEELSR